MERERMVVERGRHDYNLDSCSSRLRAIGFTAGEQELKTFTIFSVWYESDSEEASSNILPRSQLRTAQMVLSVSKVGRTFPFSIFER